MFAELHLPLQVVIDRDDIEDAVVAELTGAECVGAGVGVDGSNLDFELGDRKVDEVATDSRRILSSLGVAGGHCVSKVSTAGSTYRTSGPRHPVVQSPTSVMRRPFAAERRTTGRRGRARSRHVATC